MPAELQEIILHEQPWQTNDRVVVPPHDARVDRDGFLRKMSCPACDVGLVTLQEGEKLSDKLTSLQRHNYPMPSHRAMLTLWERQLTDRV